MASIAPGVVSVISSTLRPPRTAALHASMSGVSAPRRTQRKTPSARTSRTVLSIRSCSLIENQRLAAGLLLGGLLELVVGVDRHFDATVGGTACRGLIARDRLRFAIAHVGEARLHHLLAGKIVLDRLRAQFGQLQIPVFAALLELGLVHVEEQSGIERDLDTLADALDLGAFEVLLHFGRLLVHVVADDTARRTAHRRADDAADDSTGSRAAGRTFLRVRHAAAAQTGCREREHNDAGRKFPHNELLHVRALLKGA